MAFLNDEAFRQVVAATPLVAIDLIVQDETGRFLLGLRRNRPAAGYWFVPGGRIMKNETLGDAFKRLTSAELGLAADIARARWTGPFEHFYRDSKFGDAPDTHYVVLAYRLLVDRERLDLPTAQHSDYRWMSVNEILADPDVHPHTRAYFVDPNVA